jgi:DNA-binding NarL/FixJ family response regulator
VKRVLILSRHSTFSLGIETLLAQEDGIEIVSRGRDADPNATIECILTNRPDVVMVNCDDPEPELCPVIQCILRDRPEIRVIGLSLQNNKISIFQGEKKQVCLVDDLLKAIGD